jgi:hypothetical protein
MLNIFGDVSGARQPHPPSWQRTVEWDQARLLAFRDWGLVSDQLDY